MNISLTLQGITLGGVLLLVFKGLNEHKIWVRMKDRLNTLWYKHCQETGDKYEPLGNGHS